MLDNGLKTWPTGLFISSWNEGIRKGPSPPPPRVTKISVKYCKGNLAISKITSYTEWKEKKQLKDFNDPFPVGQTGLTNKEIARKDIL